MPGLAQSRENRRTRFAALGWALGGVAGLVRGHYGPAGELAWWMHGLVGVVMVLVMSVAGGMLGYILRRLLLGKGDGTTGQSHRRPAAPELDPTDLVQGDDEDLVQELAEHKGPRTDDVTDGLYLGAFFGAFVGLVACLAVGDWGLAQVWTACGAAAGACLFVVPRDMAGFLMRMLDLEERRG